MSNFKIKVYPSKKDSFKQIKAVEDGLFPKAFSSILLIGKTNSGKTMVLVNLLKEDNMFKDFYHEIIYMSPTAKTDSIVGQLNLNKENIFDDISNGIFILEKIIESQEKLIKKKGEEWVFKNNRLALVFDDVLSYGKFLRSTAFKKIATQGRHLSLSSFILTQSYKGIPSNIRTQVRGMAFFPADQNEMKKFTDEQCAVGKTSKQFMRMISYANADRHSFLWVNNDADPKKKYFKNFEEQINLEDYT